jgi:hypothetical protein
VHEARDRLAPSLSVLMLRSVRALPPFSLSTVTEYGHTEELASFASLEEAEEALFSLYDALEEASSSRAFSLQCMISELEEQISFARLCAEAEAEEAAEEALS